MNNECSNPMNNKNPYVVLVMIEETKGDNIDYNLDLPKNEERYIGW